MSEIAIVILAAGKGTRMNSRLPKVLHPVAGRALLHHVLATAADLKPARTAVVLGPDMDDVAAEVAAASPGAVVAVQADRLGTGHALGCAREALAGHGSDVLVLYGDVPLVRRVSLEALVAARRSSGAAIAVLGFRPADPTGYGRLVVDGDDRVARIVEQVAASPEEAEIGLCNSGILAIDGAQLWSLLDQVQPDNAKGEYFLTDIVALAVANGGRCVHSEVDDPSDVLGVNDRAQLADIEAILQQRLRGAAMAAGVTMVDPTTVWMSWDTRLAMDVTIGPNVVFGPGVTVAEGADIRAFSHLEGVRVGAGAQIGPYARLRPGSDIGDGARVGNFVETKKAIIAAGAKVNHLSYIGDAEVGEKANIGAGTITCNYDGYAKSLTRIGAGAFIGSNSALVAPVRIGDGAVVGAGSVITEDVSDDAIVTARGTQQAREGAAARRRARIANGKDD
jgi:bifunctional UDP-N-acetylglucosamine pyrophosphorylase/glucosamine-1-phosphate N-acetyltransferase